VRREGSRRRGEGEERRAARGEEEAQRSIGERRGGREAAKGERRRQHVLSRCAHKLCSHELTLIGSRIEMSILYFTPKMPVSTSSFGSFVAPAEPLCQMHSLGSSLLHSAITLSL
jgi:hypothetical protein